MEILLYENQGTPTSKKFTEKHTEVAEKMYSHKEKNSNKIFKFLKFLKKNPLENLKS